MREHDKIDEVLLAAFVDDELDASNREMIINAMDSDEDLRDRVYELRKTKDLMKLSFGDATSPSNNPVNFTRILRNQCIMRVAAGISALAIGASAGYTGYKYCSHEGFVPAHTLTELTQQQGNKIIVHISESDPTQFEMTLAYTEEFLRKHQSSSNAQIEVVANAGGVDLLREGFPLNDQVTHMMDEFDNLTFIACTNAINRLVAQGLDPAMIREVETDKAALTHIIERMQNGWKYVKADVDMLKM